MDISTKANPQKVDKGIPYIFGNFDILKAVSVEPIGEKQKVYPVA